MSLLSRIVHELTRDRTFAGKRFARSSRGSRSGVALLLTITCVMLMTILATQMTVDSTVQLKLAANQRDQVKAEALARSGLNFYRMLLMASKGLKNSPMAGMVPPQFQGMLGNLWMMVPEVNTGLLRMIFVSDGDLDDFAEGGDDGEGGSMLGAMMGGGAEALTDEQRAESRENGAGSRRSFLDFDGDFTAVVSDESQRINVNLLVPNPENGTGVAGCQADPVCSQLHQLMVGNFSPLCSIDPQQGGTAPGITEDGNRFFWDRGLDPYELAWNLVDWRDPDSDRGWQGGDENQLYQRLDEPYMAKNSNFDSIPEIRLVDGWHRDDVWDRFGRYLTVYGPNNGGVNVNTASCEVVMALFQAGTPNRRLTPQELVSAWQGVRYHQQLNVFGSAWRSPSDFIETVRQLSNPQSLMAEYLQMTGGTGGQAQAFLPVNFTEEELQTIERYVAVDAAIFRIRSTGQVGDARVTVEAVYDFNSGLGGRLLYWNME